MCFEERSFRVTSIKLSGPIAGDLHDQKLGNNADALHNASQMLRLACEKNSDIPMCEICFELSDPDDEEDSQGVACLSITDGVLYLSVPA